LDQVGTWKRLAEKNCHATGTIRCQNELDIAAGAWTGANLNLGKRPYSGFPDWCYALAFFTSHDRAGIVAARAEGQTVRVPDFPKVLSPGRTAADLPIHPPGNLMDYYDG